MLVRLWLGCGWVVVGFGLMLGVSWVVVGLQMGSG